MPLICALDQLRHIGTTGKSVVANAVKEFFWSYGEQRPGNINAIILEERERRIVMAGLVPAIHVGVSRTKRQDVDHREKHGDDGFDADAGLVLRASQSPGAHLYDPMAGHEGARSSDTLRSRPSPLWGPRRAKLTIEVARLSGANNAPVGVCLRAQNPPPRLRFAMVFSSTRIAHPYPRICRKPLEL
jgi:hypothetical protein